jgi:hypothetical protein
MVRRLHTKNMDFYIYKIKEKRSFKIILKNICPSTNLKELKQKINTKYHTVINMKYAAKDYKTHLYSWLS